MLFSSRSIQKPLPLKLGSYTSKSITVRVPFLVRLLLDRYSLLVLEFVLSYLVINISLLDDYRIWVETWILNGLVEVSAAKFYMLFVRR